MLVFRTTDTVEAVHSSDPRITTPGVPLLSDDGQWLSAVDQPAEAMRVVVRPMSSAQYRTMVAAQEAKDPQALDMAIRDGVVSIDGAPVDLAALSYGAAAALSTLVVGVTLAPLIGRRSPSEGAESTAGSGGAD